MKDKSPSSPYGRLSLLAVIVFSAILAYMSFQNPEFVHNGLRVLEIPAAPPLPDVPDGVGVLASAGRPGAQQRAEDMRPGSDRILDAQGLPIIWTLELMTLSHLADARALEARLEAGGYPAYVRQVEGSRGAVLYRVFAGPTFREDQLDAMRHAIERSYSLTGVPVRFQP